MTRDFFDYIEDIICAIDEIAEFIQNMDYETFSGNKKTINAVIRSLEGKKNGGQRSTLPVILAVEPALRYGLRARQSKLPRG